MSRPMLAGMVAAAIGIAGCGQRASQAPGSSAGAQGGTATTATQVGTVTASVVTATTTTDHGTFPGGVGGAAGDVHPRVSPADGAPRTTFVVTLVSRSRLGTQGVLLSAYRIEASVRPASARCPTATANIASGAPGQRERAVLVPPANGWCRGSYVGVVYLERGPNCAQGSPCPEFASRVTEVGRFQWRVR